VESGIVKFIRPFRRMDGIIIMMRHIPGIKIQTLGTVIEY